ncbi:MAG: DUF3450 family protein [Phycisphaerae bacterium]|jgi:FtsZ-binding cell division protein ZapB
MKLKTWFAGKRPRIKEMLVTGTLFSAVLWGAAVAAPTAAQEDITNVEQVRVSIEKWIETKGLISKEKRDFELKSEVLNQRIDLVKQEIEALQEKIKGAEKSIVEADKKREELVKENDELKKAATSLQDVLSGLEKGVLSLIKRLPEPIVQRVKPLSQRIPENVEETKLSVSERFQNVVGILNEVEKFNREITVTSEVRVLPDGKSVEVTAVYLGIGQAFYASANGAIAGVGTASDKGWVWRPDNLSAPEISDAIAILKNEKVAAFVQLPTEIK